MFLSGPWTHIKKMMEKGRQVCFLLGLLSQSRITATMQLPGLMDSAVLALNVEFMRSL